MEAIIEGAMDKREEIKSKLRQCFDGKIVRKDLTKKIKEVELLGNLSSCQYIDSHQSIVLQGFTGSGKTYLACALGKQACLSQFRALYIRLPDLLMEYGDCAAIIGSPKKLLNRYGKIPLLREEIARNSVENTVQNSRPVQKQQNN